MTDLAGELEALYRHFNRREFVAPDPLEVLYDYPAAADREIAGLLAACLAYGQVRSIVATLRRLLPRLGPAPARFLDRASEADLRAAAAGIQHRWTRPVHIAALLRAMKRARAEAGSLEALMGRVEGDVVAPLTTWSAWLRRAAEPGDVDHLISDPARGSTCKRLHLFLRWMTREDAVDPGGWTLVPPSALVVPVDVHMHRIGRALRFTRRSAPSLSAAREITEAFRRVCPADPVRYDFALTRLGIRERATGQGGAALRRRIAAALRGEET